jgi:hypothetical protein
VNNPSSAPPFHVNVRVSFDYVLIIEWLGPTDTKTGEALFDELARMGVRASLVRCKSSLDVWLALVKAQQQFPTRGIPAVHIEAHGVPLEHCPDGEPRFGDGVTSSLRWSEVGGWLAPINEESKFRLLLVSASCWGHAALATMTTEHAAPFAVCVGFSTKVSAVSLRAAMSALYWHLLERDAPFDDSFSAAERELYSKDEKLEKDTAVKVGYEVLRLLARHVSEPTEIAAMIARARASLKIDGIEPAADYDAAYPGKIDTLLRPSCQRSWNTWFPPALQHRDEIYRLDWERVRAVE